MTVPAPDPSAAYPLIFAEVSPVSLRQALLGPEPCDAITEETVTDFYSRPAAQEETVRRLREHGFQVPHPKASALTVTVGGTVEQYWNVFGVQLEQVTVTRPVDLAESANSAPVQTYWTPRESGDPGYYAEPPQALAGVIEGVVFPQPAELHSNGGAAGPGLPSATPPAVNGYYYLNVPDDVARLLRADAVHRQRITGAGVVVAMIDSGHYTQHPYFGRYLDQIEPVVRDGEATLRNLDPLQDMNGHGTMESANLLAIAPGCTMIPVLSLLNNPVDAFKVARTTRPHIISCSWGYEMRGLSSLRQSDRPLEAEIADAVRAGIVVVFSAGNGQVAWPAMHPDVIAAGGVYVDREGQMRASDYASSFVSPIFAGRAVPDVSGLVGLLPDAKYIMLPGQPGSAMDVRYANRFLDGTAPNDGWAVLSGTSAAAPQVAGVVALLLQARPGLRPAVVKNLLRRTGRDVTAGTTNPTADQPTGAHPATPGPDLATGGGLVDATRAVTLGRLQAAVSRFMGGVAAAPVAVGAAQPVAPSTGAAVPVSTPPGPTARVVAANAVAGPSAADGSSATVEITVRLVVRVEVAGIEVGLVGATVPAPPVDRSPAAPPVAEAPLPPLPPHPPVAEVPAPPPPAPSEIAPPTNPPATGTTWTPPTPAAASLDPALVDEVLADPDLAALVREALQAPDLPIADLAQRLTSDPAALGQLAALLEREPVGVPLTAPAPAPAPAAGAAVREDAPA